MCGLVWSLPWARYRAVPLPQIIPPFHSCTLCLPLPLTLGNHWSVFCHYSLVFLRMSCKTLTSFTQFKVFESSKLLNVSVVHTSLLLSIPLYECTTVGLSIHSLKDLWGFQFGAFSPEPAAPVQRPGLTALNCLSSSRPFPLISSFSSTHSLCSSSTGLFSWPPNSPHTIFSPHLCS